MYGKIIKGIAGFYYVHNGHSRVFECKAKGIFRNKKIKPLVGDDVIFDIIDDAEGTGNIVEICERKNSIVRPAAANIDQAVIVFAVREPEPNLDLLNRFLIMMEYQDIPSTIIFNKSDLADDSLIQTLQDIYCSTGYELHFISVKDEHDMDNLRDVFAGKTTVLAGPSGVGKSSLMNWLNPEAYMEVGSLSDKLKRGKHTTRHSELFPVGENSYVMDTPGFSSLSIDYIEHEQLRYYFPEFAEYEGKCRFNGCVHDKEPDCAVKEALAAKELSSKRYNNYINLLNELKNVKRY
ncbi:MAG: ribosome small subunit-dependent GTPase A [Lachnospiraceae bacterium]|nr:ribosome small subunit-dependent GTPase A [Lachnospiraceae bacterium]